MTEERDLRDRLLDETRPLVALYVGMSGAGKTYALAEDACARVDAGRSSLVIDTTREWNASPATCERVTVGYVKEARAAFDHGARMVVVAAPRDRTIGVSRQRTVAPTIEFAAMDALDAGRDLVVTEGHMHMPEGQPLGVQVATLVTQFRHYRAALLLDSQRFAAIPKRVVSQASSIRLFAVAGRRDLAVVDDLGGPALVEAINEAARRFAVGEPGWHVQIDPRRPPHAPELVRL